MKKEINLKSSHMLDFWTFMLFYSPRARTEQLFNTLGIFGEAMIAGFVIDWLFKTQFFTIIGAIFSVAWLIFYPRFLKRKRLKALRSMSCQDAEKKMIFEVDEKEIALYEDVARDDTKFGFDMVSEIYELKNIFAIFLKGKIHLIIPKDSQSKEMVSLVAKNSKKHILKYENLEFDLVAK